MRYGDMPQLKKAYSEAEISRLSRKELEQAFMTLQEAFTTLKEINQGLNFKIRADNAAEYVAEKVKGVLPGSIHSPHDVLSGSGHKLEIKVSKLVSPNKTGAPSSRVWKWNRLLGDRRNKVYDQLILLGLAIRRAQDEDRRNGREPRAYEIFDLSFADAQTLAELTRFHTFQVNTNQQKAHAEPGAFVWEHHIELEELVQRYSMKKKPLSNDGSGESPRPAEIAPWGTTRTLDAA